MHLQELSDQHLQELSDHEQQKCLLSLSIIIRDDRIVMSYTHHHYSIIVLLYELHGMRFGSYGITDT
jgi:hypothetical protein